MSGLATGLSILLYCFIYLILSLIIKILIIKNLCEALKSASKSFNFVLFQGCFGNFRLSEFPCRLCQFLQRKGKCYKNCVVSIYQYEWYFNNIKYSNP